MKKQVLLALLAGVVVLFSFSTGCGKKKKEEQQGTVTQTQMEATQPEPPKFEIAKIDKAAEGLADFSDLVKKFSSQPKPTDMAVAQRQADANLAEANELAKKYGFVDISEMQEYIQLLLFLHNLSEIKDKLTAVPAEKRSQGAKDSLEQVEMLLAQVKGQLGEQAIENVKKHKDKIQQFLKNTPVQ